MGVGFFLLLFQAEPIYVDNSNHAWKTETEETMQKAAPDVYRDA